MNKEKFEVPELDEELIQKQIRLITAGQPTFLKQFNSLLQQVGIRYLFADRRELSFILAAGVLFFSMLFIQFYSMPKEKIYAALFLISPILFLILSLYAYWTKIEQDTFEVEMTCKITVYQMMAFRMLAFSVVSIAVNSLFIGAVGQFIQQIDFMRAFMISVTSLFLFSTIILWAFRKRRALPNAVAATAGWIAVNLLLHYAFDQWYSAFLLKIPLLVYGIVLLGSLYGYGRLIKNMLLNQQMKGAY